MLISKEAAKASRQQDGFTRYATYLSSSSPHTPTPILLSAFISKCQTPQLSQRLCIGIALPKQWRKRRHSSGGREHRSYGSESGGAGRSQTIHPSSRALSLLLAKLEQALVSIRCLEDQLKFGQPRGTQQTTSRRNSFWIV